MKIEWFGHASFGISSQNGLRIVTDPYEAGYRGIINYGPINQAADIVTVSHEHGDHNCVAAVLGSPTVLKNPGISKVKGLEFSGIASYHDRVQGVERGANTIFRFAVDGISVAHLGDLGHSLSTEQLNELKDVEVLFVPIGGPAATLELQEAIDLWEKLRPRVVIPMHFRTAKCPFPKYGPEDLTRLRPTARKTGTSEITLTRDNLSAGTQVLVLESSR